MHDTLKMYMFISEDVVLLFVPLEMHFYKIMFVRFLLNV